MGILVAECGFQGPSGVSGREEARGRQPGPAGCDHGPGCHLGRLSLGRSQLPLPVAPGHHLREPSTSPRPGRGAVLIGAGLVLDTQGRPHCPVCPSVSDLAGLGPPPVPGGTVQLGPLWGVLGTSWPGDSVLPLRPGAASGSASPHRPRASGPAGLVAGMFDFSRLFPTRTFAAPRERAPASLFFEDLTPGPRS